MSRSMHGDRLQPGTYDVPMKYNGVIQRKPGFPKRRLPETGYSDRLPNAHYRRCREEIERSSVAVSLSERPTAANRTTITFAPDALSRRLRRDHPKIVFALLLGSATDCTVRPGSHLDLALFSKESPGSDQLYEIICTVEDVVPGAPVDVGILNENEPVYRFEGLKGRRMFTTDQEAWLHFYSITCREYKHWMWHYEKQRRYRLER